MAEEKRRFTRIHFRVKAEMTVNDVLSRAGEISNLSVAGAASCLLGQIWSREVYATLECS